MLYSYFVSCLSDSLYLINNLQTGSCCNGQSHQRYCVWYCSEKCFYRNTDNKRACFEGLDVDLNKEFSAIYNRVCCIYLGSKLHRRCHLILIKILFSLVANTFIFCLLTIALLSGIKYIHCVLETFNIVISQTCSNAFQSCLTQL